MQDLEANISIDAEAQAVNTSQDAESQTIEIQDAGCQTQESPIREEDQSRLGRHGSRKAKKDRRTESKKKIDVDDRLRVYAQDQVQFMTLARMSGPPAIAKIEEIMEETKKASQRADMSP